MRKLKTTDLFKMSKIYSKMGITLKLEEKMTQMELGTHLVNEFVSNIHKCEKEVIEFLADLKGVSSKEVEEMGLSDFTNVIKEFMELDGLNDFFSQVMA